MEFFFLSLPGRVVGLWPIICFSTSKLMRGMKTKCQVLIPKKVFIGNKKFMTYQNEKKIERRCKSILTGFSVDST